MRTIILLALMALAPASYAQCEAQAKEPFADFFTRFAASKAFAINRTLYPTKTIRHEYGLEDGKEVHDKVETTVTRVMDATSPTITELLQRNSMESKQRSLSSRVAVVEVFKPDSDWLLTYHFQARGNCWYLHHIEDRSL